MHNVIMVNYPGREEFDNARIRCILDVECVFFQTDPLVPAKNHVWYHFQVNKKIFVRGLPWETTDQSLRAVFEQYGEIAEVRFSSMAYG